MNIGIVGYGKMGSAICKAMARSPHPVTVCLREESTAKEAGRRYAKKLERSARRNTNADLSKKQSSPPIVFTHRLEDLASANLIIENIDEAFGSKAALLQKLESVVAGNALLTTNTSSISISRLAQCLGRTDRFCGLHFFHPVVLIQLVEIIRGKNTSPSTVKKLEALCREIGRQTVTVDDGPGSVINRVLAYYYLEALYILEEGGILPSQLDEIARALFYIGPCESIDAVGVDFFAAALAQAVDGEIDAGSDSARSFQHDGARNAQELYRGFFWPELLGKLCAEKRFGRRVNNGIYLYPKGRPVDDRQEYYARRKTPSDTGSPAPLAESVKERLLFSIFNGVLESNSRSLASLEALDTGIREVLQMKQGPVVMMANIGIQKVAAKLQRLSSRFGIRFRQPSIGLLASRESMREGALDRSLKRLG